MDIGSFVRFIGMLLYLAILARVLVTWIAPGRMDNPLVALIFQITEPMLAPIRRVMPKTGMFDFAPIVAMILLTIILSFIP